MDKAEKIIAECVAIGDKQAAADGFGRYPAMAGALQAHVRMLCAEIASLERMNRAPSSKGMEEIEYCGMVVHFDYTPAERATHWEPGCDEQVEVCAVYANGMDVFEYLSDEIVEAITDRCYQEVKAQRKQDEEDRAESSYLDRMAA